MAEYDLRLDEFQKKFIITKCPEFNIAFESSEYEVAGMYNFKFSKICFSKEDCNNFVGVSCYTYCNDRKTPVRPSLEKIVSNIKKGKKRTKIIEDIGLRLERPSPIKADTNA